MLDRNDTHEEVEHQSHLDKAPQAALPEATDVAKDDSSTGQMTRLPPATSSGPPHRTGRWTPDEKILFLYGLKRFGKGRWKKMSIYLPHRSLVQIKSHAQKVLKRLEAGENVFRRLEENYNVIDNLIVQAAKQRGDNLADPKSMSTIAKRSKAAVSRQEHEQIMASYNQGIPSDADRTMSAVDNDNGTAVIAAAALCQLSSLSC